MPIGTMTHERAVQPSRDHLQDGVGAGPHSVHHGRSALAHSRVKAVRARLREHARGTAVSGQPQHRPEGVIVLDAEGIVISLSVISPQAARVE